MQHRLAILALALVATQSIGGPLEALMAQEIKKPAPPDHQQTQRAQRNAYETAIVKYPEERNAQDNQAIWQERQRSLLIETKSIAEVFPLMRGMLMDCARLQLALEHPAASKTPDTSDIQICLANFEHIQQVSKEQIQENKAKNFQLVQQTPSNLFYEETRRNHEMAKLSVIIYTFQNAWAYAGKMRKYMSSNLGNAGIVAPNDDIFAK